MTINKKIKRINYYYELLGITSNTTCSEMKKAFRKEAKKYHPDKNPDGLNVFLDLVEAREELKEIVCYKNKDYNPYQRKEENKFHASDDSYYFNNATVLILFGVDSAENNATKYFY